MQKGCEASEHVKYCSDSMKWERTTMPKWSKTLVMVKTIIRRVIKSTKAQEVAVAQAQKMRHVCRVVLKKRNTHWLLTICRSQPVFSLLCFDPYNCVSSFPCSAYFKYRWGALDSTVDLVFLAQHTSSIDGEPLTQHSPLATSWKNAHRRDWSFDHP